MVVAARKVCVRRRDVDSISESSQGQSTRGRRAIVLLMSKVPLSACAGLKCLICLTLVLLRIPEASVAFAQQGGEIQSWVAPRTPHGHPDIQGVWTNATMTPLERPADLANQEFLSEGEVLEREGLARVRREEQLVPGRTQLQRLPEGSPIAGYNGAIWSAPRGIVSTRRTSMVVDPPNGRIPVRPEAESRRDYLVANRTDSYSNMSVYTRCITRGVPGSMIPNFYNDGNHILQTSDYVAIIYEMIGEARLIPLNGRPAISSGIGLWMGDSRGRWEGETLVIETTNFSGKGWITPNQNARRMLGVPVSRDLHVVEQFTRVSEDVLEWRVTVDDPQVFTRPWTLELPLTRDPEYDLYEYACHEGNYSVANSLRGARVKESAARNKEE